MKTPLKVGDRVRVYGKPGPDGGCWEAVIAACRVVAPWGVGMDVRSTYDNELYTVHPKQCRRLIKKPRRRMRIKISEEGGLLCDMNNSENFRVLEFIRHSPDGCCLEFIEVKPKGEK